MDTNKENKDQAAVPEEKTPYQLLMEMPYSTDRIGQAFIMPARLRPKKNQEIVEDQNEASKNEEKNSEKPNTKD